jgi:hypothetical protein
MWNRISQYGIFQVDKVEWKFMAQVAFQQFDIHLYKHIVLDENIWLLWFIIFVMNLCLGRGIFLI